MGYTISIGNAKLALGDREFFITIDDVRDLTPVWGDGWEARVPRHEADNTRCPAYSSWDGFMRRAGLRQWWNDLTDDAASDCRVFQLTQDDVDRVQRAQAGIADQYDQLRAEWLYRWISWAVANCERPAIQVG